MSTVHFIHIYVRILGIIGLSRIEDLVIKVLDLGIKE